VRRIVFLLEEPSMKVFLEVLLARILPGLQFLCLQHEGKQDLELSIPRKLRAWKQPGDHFMIVRDNDGGDCLALKRRLRDLCEKNGRPDTLIRLACQELEAWYFGEPDALALAYEDQNLKTLSSKAKYRDPDAVDCPSRELERLIPQFQKTSGARTVGKLLTEVNNKSKSFQVFLSGIRRMATL
jgi:hypothetical protein